MNNILKFNDYVNELWSRDTEPKELEDITDINEYIDTVEWVDMGHPKYLFAKYDCEKYFDINDIKKIIEILPQNIKIAGKREFDFLTKECDCTIDKDPETNRCTFKYSSPNQKDMVYCKIAKNKADITYLNKIFSIVDNKAKVRYYVFRTYKRPYTETFIFTTTCTPHVKHLSIKLIKKK